MSKKQKKDQEVEEDLALSFWFAEEHEKQEEELLDRLIIETKGDNVDDFENPAQPEWLLDDFVIYQSHDHAIFNLEQLSFADAIIAASGTVKLLPREFNDDDDEDVVERYKERERTFEPFRAQLGRIAQWSVSYDIASASKTNIWIRTDFCWYRLGQPLEQYAEQFFPLQIKSQLCSKVIAILGNNPGATFADFVKEITAADDDAEDDDDTWESNALTFSEDDLVENAEFILQQIDSLAAEHDNAELWLSPFFQELNVRLEAKKKLPNKKLAGKSSLRANQTKATTTPLVYSIWKGFWAKTLAFNRKVIKNKAAPKKAAKPKKGLAEKSKLFETRKLNIQWIGAPVKTESTDKGKRTYYKSVYVNNTKYEVGEAVYVQSPTEGEDEFIAIITSLWRQGEDNLFHALWFCKSKDTVLGDSGSEHELFLTDLCDNNYLEALIGKPDRLVYVKPDEPTPDFGESPDSFFFRLFYHQGKVCFTNPPYQMDCTTGDCPVCKHKETSKPTAVPVSDPIKDDGKHKLYDSFQYNGVTYRLNDTIYLDPSEVDIASINEDDDTPAVRSDKKKKKKKEEGDKSPSKTIDAFFKPVGKSGKKGDDVSATSEESSYESSEEEDDAEEEDDMDEDEDEDKPKKKSGKSTKVVVTGAKAKPKPAATESPVKKEAIKEEVVVKTEGAADASATNGTATEPIKVEAGEETNTKGRKMYVRPEGEEGWRTRYPKALAADKAFRKRVYNLNPYYIARILKIAGRRNSNALKIHVQVFYRLKQVKGKKALGSDREIFFTEREEVLKASNVKGKCVVRHYNSIVKGQENKEEALNQHRSKDHHYYFREGFVIRTKEFFEAPMPQTDGSQDLVDQIDLQATQTVTPLRTMDLFSGCGGLSTGLEQSGVSKTYWAVEKDTAASESCLRNHEGCKVYNNDINELLKRIISGDPTLPKKGEVDMIVGGPPCQGFSGLNRFQERTKGEETINALVVTYLSFIDHFKPRFAVMENVKGLLSTAKGNVCALILSTLIAIGYQVRLGILNAGQFGLPQSRVRLIVMASKVGDVLPEFPVPTHTFIIQGARFREIPVALGRSGAQSAPGVLTTTRMALSDLPEIEYGATKTNGLSYATEPPSDFARELRGKETEVTNHITRGLDELNFTRISSIPREKPGVDWRSLPDHLIPWCLPNTADRHNDWRGLYGRLDWDAYWKTVLCNPNYFRHAVIHPNQDRVVSVRECARAQGFPDDFRFLGKIFAQYKQVGNAVPPPLARAIGKEVKKAMITAEEKKPFTVVIKTGAETPAPMNVDQDHSANGKEENSEKTKTKEKKSKSKKENIFGTSNGDDAHNSDENSDKENHSSNKNKKASSSQDEKKGTKRKRDSVEEVSDDDVQLTRVTKKAKVSAGGDKKEKKKHKKKKANKESIFATGNNDM